MHRTHTSALHPCMHTYTALHYSTLHCITLHYNTLPYNTLQHTTLHYTKLTTLYYRRWHYIALHYVTYGSTCPFNGYVLTLRGLCGCTLQMRRLLGIELRLKSRPEVHAAHDFWRRLSRGSRELTVGAAVGDHVA